MAFRLKFEIRLRQVHRQRPDSQWRLHQDQHCSWAQAVLKLRGLGACLAHPHCHPLISTWLGCLLPLQLALHHPASTLQFAQT